MTALALLAVPVAAQDLRLVALGDSLTQGYGLPAEEGFVPVLQAWLRGRGHDVEVINAGVSGDTTAGGLARMDWTLADGPDAMIVALGGNDLLRGIDPAASRANLSGILAAADGAGVPVLLAGLPAPGNYGPDFKRDFEAMYADLAEQWGAIHYPDFLGPIGEKAAAGLSLSDLMQEDRIHPNAEGVRQIVAAIGPEVERLLARTTAPEG
ncbi:arylesterase [Rhodobaculum claviforme]|uniref:Arylesterase n=1 Tax=Rhodobaculum claviforme TaxID=1549854 RepID=A0A934WII8_9RHOB|nr:arylesterase [Rhodobaculum claviforme]